jgi:hypothetical protein
MTTEATSREQPTAADKSARALPPRPRVGFDQQGEIPVQLATQAAQLHELRGEADRLRAERDRLLEQQSRIAELLRCADPQTLVHDLRNLLNELNLYKALVETQEKV